jgi:hypothetical protein
MRILTQGTIENDAPPSAREEARKGHRDLLSMLGIDSEPALGRKVDELRKLLPGITSAAEKTIARNPEVMHGQAPAAWSHPSSGRWTPGTSENPEISPVMSRVFYRPSRHRRGVVPSGARRS